MDLKCVKFRIIMGSIAIQVNFHLKNGPSKICGRQPLKNFTRSILEYFVPFVLKNIVLELFLEILEK